MHTEDWICSNCGDLQFARNDKCRKCGEPKPRDAGGPAEGKAKGKMGGGGWEGEG